MFIRPRIYPSTLVINPYVAIYTHAYMYNHTHPGEGLAVHTYINTYNVHTHVHTD